MASKSFYAIVAGVGPGTGRASAIKFAEKYSVVLLARNPKNYESIVDEIKQSGGHAIGITADVTNPSSLDEAFQSIKQQLPDSKLAAGIYNVNGGFSRKPYLELTYDELQLALGGTVNAFFFFSQKTLPLLLESVPDSPYPPTLIITGATASVRGSAQFGSFAAGKFALRALGQSLSREFHPKGVHIAHVIIDGVIDIPIRQQIANGGVEDGKIKPESIAETYWHLHAQHRSAFAQEIDIRPYVEKF